jgi:hypothetical protein
MKRSIIILFSFLGACSTTIINQKPEGVYVCQFENEFSKIADTLFLQRLNSNYYKITRHSGLINKNSHKKRRITEVWKLEFEETKNVFTEIKTGKVLIWDADKHELIFGNRDYIRK